VRPIGRPACVCENCGWDPRIDRRGPSKGENHGWEGFSERPSTNGPNVLFCHDCCAEWDNQGRAA
jgi:hypothetical protein